MPVLGLVTIGVDVDFDLKTWILLVLKYLSPFEAKICFSKFHLLVDSKLVKLYQHDTFSTQHALTMEQNPVSTRNLGMPRGFLEIK